MRETTEKVCTLQARIAARIGDSRYRTWFADKARFELAEQRLTVTVASAFVGNWIASNFMDDLQEAMHETVGDGGVVRLRVGTADGGEHTNGSAQNDRPRRPSRAERSIELRTDRSRRGPRFRGQLGSFVVGPCNQLAYAAACALARRDAGNGLRHLLLHGASGLGKTHLLQGIANEYQDSHPAQSCCYVSGEEFTNEFVYALKSGRLESFRARFRGVDVLLIDDLHFLAHKSATQQEFLHTFDAIDGVGKTIVMTTDKHPRAMTALSDPLVSRLIAATVVEIEPPGLETRREILRRRAAQMKRDLPEPLIHYVASRITRNVRELEGALYKIIALQTLSNEPLNFELAQRALEESGAVGPVRPDAEQIQRAVARYFGVNVRDLLSASRDRTVVTARGVAMYLIRKELGLSFPEIGRRMKRRHSTVCMACRRIEETVERTGVLSWRAAGAVREQPVATILELIREQLAGRTEAPRHAD